MGQQKNIDMSTTDSDVKIVDGEKKTSRKSTVKVKKLRGKKFTATRSKVDKTKLYDPFAAVELIKQLSFSRFDGTIEAHLVVKKTGTSVGFNLPHSTGKTIKVEIASEEVLKNIEAGKIDFDVLVSAPEFMPKLAKFARLLGPKGLMPNPKNGTLTSQPEAKKKELAAGKTMLKTEKKAPLIHLIIGKVSMDTKQLVENLNALIAAFKNDLVKLSLSATMSPGVKVDFESQLNA